MHVQAKTLRLTPATLPHVLDECSWFLPVSEANTWNSGNAAQASNQTKDDQEDDKEDLQDSEPEFDLACAWLEQPLPLQPIHH